MSELTRYVPRSLRDDGMVAASEVAHYELNLCEYVKAADVLTREQIEAISQQVYAEKYADIVAAQRAQREQDLKRIQELEQVLNHHHVAQDGTDTCKQCGLDLRDAIHRRVNDDRPQPSVF